MHYQDEAVFVATWVEPFYLKLVNTAFLNLAADEEAEFISAVKVALAKIDATSLRRMISAMNWRPRLTAAWFIGFLKAHDLSQAIGEAMLRYPHDAAIPCFALARIGDARAIPPLEAYLKQYLIIESAQKSTAEQLAVDYALVALQTIAPRSAAAFYPQQWDDFIEASQPCFLCETDRQISQTRTWDLERSRQRLQQWLTFAETHFD